MVGNPPLDDGGDGFSGQGPAIEGRVAGQGTRLADVEGPAFFRVEDGYVRVIAAGQRSAPAQVKYMGRANREEFYYARQRDFVFAVEPGDGQSESGLETGDAEGRALEFHFFFVAGVRGMIGGN